MKNIFHQSKFSRLIKYIKNKKNILLNLGAIFIIIFSISFAWHEADKNRKRQRYPENINKYQAEIKDISSPTVAEILEKVRKKVEIDSSSEPLIVAIKDSKTLKNEQDFFKDSNDGDILIVDSKKAIIYRPSIDALIKIGPVYFSER